MREGLDVVAHPAEIDVMDWSVRPACCQVTALFRGTGRVFVAPSLGAAFVYQQVGQGSFGWCSSPADRHKGHRQSEIDRRTDRQTDRTPRASVDTPCFPQAKD